MAPEAPGNLIVIDLRFRDEELIGYTQSVDYYPEQTARIEAAGGWFYVLWSQTPREDHTPVGDGVVYVQEPLPSGYRISSPRNLTEVDSFGNDRYGYSFPALGEGLMFVLILPEGYTLAESQPMPRKAKVFKNRRLAVYWKPEGKYGAQVEIWWRIKKCDRNLKSERERIYEYIERSGNVPYNAGAIVDPDSTAEEEQASAIDVSWRTSLYYLGAFILLLAAILLVSIIAGNNLPAIIVGTILSFCVVMAVLLLHHGRLSQENFLKLMDSVLQRLPGISRAGRSNGESEKDNPRQSASKNGNDV